MIKGDPYLYDDVDVLINKFNVKDNEKLDQLESDVISGQILILKRNAIVINSVFDCLNIHKFLFGPIFEWAGKIRTITMYKREPILNGYTVDYTPAGYIEKELSDLEKKFRDIKWNSLTSEDKLLNVVDVIQELWQVHPFREGNTRTVSMFLYFLMKTVGLHINTEFIGKNAKYFRNSLVLASVGSLSRKEFLTEIIKDVTTEKNISNQKYQTIDGFEVEKYHYENHTMEKLKTIKSIDDLRK